MYMYIIFHLLINTLKSVKKRLLDNYIIRKLYKMLLWCDMIKNNYFINSSRGNIRKLYKVVKRASIYLKWKEQTPIYMLLSSQKFLLNEAIFFRFVVNSQD